MKTSAEIEAREVPGGLEIVLRGVTGTRMTTKSVVEMMVLPDGPATDLFRKHLRRFSDTRG